MKKSILTLEGCILEDNDFVRVDFGYFYPSEDVHKVVTILKKYGPSHKIVLYRDYSDGHGVYFSFFYTSEEGSHFPDNYHTRIRPRLPSDPFLDVKCSPHTGCRVVMDIDDYSLLKPEVKTALITILKEGCIELRLP